MSDCCHIKKEKEVKKESSCCEKSSKINTKVKVMILLFLGVIGISFFPMFSALHESLFSYLKLIWWAVLLGILFGGIIDYFIPDEFVFKFLGGKRKRNIFYAVIAGFLMSACSHGILAIAMQLHKKGASIPAVITFLLATPWANLPITILLFSFFGINALYFVLAAMVIAVITGFIYRGLEGLGWIEESKKVDVPEKVDWSHFKKFNFGEASKGVWNGMVSLSNMVLWWIIIGILVAAVIGAYVPAHFFMRFLGPSFTGILLTLFFATIIEVCSEGSSPVAFEIFQKVGVFGNPFVFLMAGVVTDYTEIGLIWSNIGKKAAIWLPIITVPMVVFVGYLFNILL